VNACSNQIPSSISNHVDGWSSLMKGSQLTPGLVDVLVATPASRYADNSYNSYMLCTLVTCLLKMVLEGNNLGKVIG
jgi:hypothetical protein